MSGLDLWLERTRSRLKENSMSTRGLLYTAAVALAVVIGYDKYGKKG